MVDLLNFRYVPLPVGGNLVLRLLHDLQISEEGFLKVVDFVHVEHLHFLLDQPGNLFKVFLQGRIINLNP